jgi:hypothetical protein
MMPHWRRLLRYRDSLPQPLFPPSGGRMYKHSAKKIPASGRGYGGVKRVCSVGLGSGSTPGVASLVDYTSPPTSNFP